MTRFLVPLVASAGGIGGYFLWSSTSAGPSPQQQAQAEQLLGAANAQTTGEVIDTSPVAEMQLGRSSRNRMWRDN